MVRGFGLPLMTKFGNKFWSFSLILIKIITWHWFLSYKQNLSEFRSSKIQVKPAKPWIDVELWNAALTAAIYYWDAPTLFWK